MPAIAQSPGRSTDGESAVVAGRVSHGARQVRLNSGLVSLNSRPVGTLAGQAIRPLPGEIVRIFDPPAHPWLAGHRGVDVAADVGTDVVSPLPGVVRFVGDIAGVPIVSIAHDGGLISTYQPVQAVVTVGDIVNAGDAIASVSEGGHCPMPCVHIGAKDEYGYRNPFLALHIWPRLLPW